ncbi:MAG: hypothetical protein AAGU78_15630, partial [Chloroflexota bacterium]
MSFRASGDESRTSSCPDYSVFAGPAAGRLADADTALVEQGGWVQRQREDNRGGGGIIGQGRR